MSLNFNSETIQILNNNQNQNLEGVLAIRKEKTSFQNLAIIICHPHPKFGGNFNNNVVSTLFNFLQNFESVSMILKLNFRGVGRSQGSSSWRGIDERQDIVAACSYLQTRTQSSLNILLIGYSFGSCVVSSIASEIESVKGYIAISYPYSWTCSILFSNHYNRANTQKPKLFIIGSNDNFTAIEALRSFVSTLDEPKQLKIIENIDHFWFDNEKMEILAKMIRDWIISIQNTI
eukprot:TRINITY_DN204_c4_g1_i1.p1 TRINITY_DN204_c4_g1~~TRINITY_DN204_c4_g1_i1.p1  ORF type:complete len:233 (-),score=77.74 TRINITY_DN204_c4_g1_i1:159-857(-)